MTEKVQCILTSTDVDSNIDPLPETDICVIAVIISAGIGVNVTPVEAIDIER